MRKLSIIIPVFNEARTIKQVLEKVERIDIPLEKEIIIVDDCSTDGTRKILTEFNHKIIFLDRNQGKGHAVMQGLELSTGDAVLIQDADLEYNIDDYSKLIRPFLNGSEVVYGSRFLHPHHPKYGVLYAGNLFLSRLTSFLYRQKITDMETCYKLIHRDVLDRIRIVSKGFEFEAEITAKILRNGIKIKEVPIDYKCRSYEEGKKIKWTDGVVAMYYLFKYRWFI